MSRLSTQQRISLTILVAALGYFVDVFDIQLFSIVRITSLKSLGLSPEEITSLGTQLLNWQMFGMLTGGLLWGVLGDKKGRVYVLFGTILLYSLANIANAFVTTIPAYAASRFFSGLGLAGEVGAGITLASELLPKNTRSYATTLILCIGVMGPTVASYVAEAFDWRTAYGVGGGLGLLLLLFRISVRESAMFASVRQDAEIPRGRLLMLINSPKRLARYLCCLAIGVPTWYVLGIFVVFSPEISAALGVTGTIKVSTAFTSYFIGQIFGSSTCGLLSQLFRNRKKVIAVLMFGSLAACAVIVTAGSGMTVPMFYALFLFAGVFATWPMFMTVTAEQFGTNLRATAATTAPNFARAAVIPCTLLIGFLKPDTGYINAIIITGCICFGFGILALWKLPESYGRDLDFVER